MNQKPLELWKQRIADRKASGLNITDWCEKNNLTKHAYYYWMKRLKADTQKPDVSMPIFAEVEPEYISAEKATKPVYIRSCQRSRSSRHRIASDKAGRRCYHHGNSKTGFFHYYS